MLQIDQANSNASNMFDPLEMNTAQRSTQTQSLNWSCIYMLHACTACPSTTLHVSCNAVIIKECSAVWMQSCKSLPLRMLNYYCTKGTMDRWPHITTVIAVHPMCSQSTTTAEYSDPFMSVCARMKQPLQNIGHNSGYMYASKTVLKNTKLITGASSHAGYPTCSPW